MTDMSKCFECQAEIDGRRPEARFCCSAHQKQFGNRAASRGAAFYHLMRANRRERSKAKQLGLWNAMCQLELYYNDIDAGKRTYLPPEMVLDDIARQDMIPTTNVSVRTA